MKYIWINPVVENMYDSSVLKEFLELQGYITINASAHWSKVVKEKYKTEITSSSKTVIDMRCPKILSFIDAYELRNQVTIPAIEPILLHCGREISERNDLKGCEKIITTPCQALADMGNALALEETTFIPWNQFLKQLKGMIPSAILQKSPIPPGFFEDLNCRMISVTEKQKICNLLEDFKPNEYDLIELLYCKDGCHNGDGICSCK